MGFLNAPVVPLMAGSRRSFLVSVMLKWNYNMLSTWIKWHRALKLTGDAVWMTLSNGGLEITALSNAPS